jgi:UDP-GlcNAc:undecaprenyl-phosphate GlcNAc-1-phosphate transferase
MLIALLTLLSLIATALLVPLACRNAASVGLVDKPGGRKRHEVETPLVGGLVIFTVFAVVSLVWLFMAASLSAPMLWFFAALAALVIVGAMDDRKHISAWVRFGIQFLVSFVIVLLAGAQLKNLGDLFGFGIFWLGFMAVPFSVIAAVLLINAINLIDGLDGLCAGNAFIVFGWMAVWCYAGGAMLHLPLLLFLMAALGGFLVYNLRTKWRSKAALFLGDAGSLGLGLAIAWFAMSLGGGKHVVIEPMAVAWMLAWPIYDICGQFARRMSEGRHPFDPDHDHFHHHFINLGVPPAKATAIILSIAFVTGFIGTGGLWLGVPLPVLTVSWMVLLLVHIYLSIKPERYRRLIAKALRHG